MPVALAELPFKPVDREYIGLARDLRRRVEAVATETTARTGAIVRSCLAEFKRRNKGLRVDELIAAEQQWRKLSSFGLLQQSIVRDRKSLVITEHRLVVNRMVKIPEVDEAVDEPGVMIVRGALSLLPGSAQWEPVTRATCSLHALGRRYGRGYGRADAAVMADLASLVTVADALIGAGPGPFRVVAPCGGCWTGQVGMLRAPGDPDTLAVMVRTFLE